MIEEALITGTRLGPAWGSLSCWLFLEFSDDSRIYRMHFGAPDVYSCRIVKNRASVSVGFNALLALLNTVGVSQWEELRHSRVRIDSTSIRGDRILKIGNFRKDKWLSFEDFPKAVDWRAGIAWAFPEDADPDDVGRRVARELREARRAELKKELGKGEER